MYYLNSRYYNPEWGRFINADALAGSVGELIGHNVFAYCKNNPVNNFDPSGYVTRNVDEDGLGEDPAPNNYDERKGNEVRCYGYTFGFENNMQNYINPGEYSYKGKGRELSDGEPFTVYEVRDLVLRDVKALDMNVVEVNSPYVDLKYNEYIVALRVGQGKDEYGEDEYDYHFMRRLSNNVWADKQGTYDSAFNRGIDIYSYSWDKGPKLGFYNSEIIFFKVTENILYCGS